MWNTKEVSKILKDYLDDNTYEVLYDRKKMAAICGDLLATFDEEKIILTMLFREGLGECLNGAPYTNTFDLSLANSRLNNFLNKVGLTSEIKDKITDTISNIVYLNSIIDEAIDINFAYNEAKENDDAWKKKKEERVELTCASDINNYICEDVEELCIISAQYKENSIPNLSVFKRLKKLHISIPIKWSQLEQINLSNMEEMTISLIDDGDIKIDAPMLKELTIYMHANTFDSLTPLERMLISKKKVFNVESLLSIRKLSISDFDGYDISSIGQIENLEHLILRRVETEDLSWLAGCKNLHTLAFDVKLSRISILPEMDSLQELRLSYSGLSSIDDIRLYPNLSVLELRSNEIRKINAKDKIAHINKVDLRKNPLEDIEDIKSIGIKDLILTEADNKKNDFNRDMQAELKRAYLITKYEEENFDTLPPFRQKRIRNKSTIQRFQEYVESGASSLFYGYNPDRLWGEYDTKIKCQYLEFLDKRYPFVTIKPEFKRQIQNETLGIQHFYKEKPGRIIYICRSIFIVDVELLDGLRRPEIEYYDNPYISVDKIKLQKVLETKCSFINFNKENVHIKLFDLYNSGNTDGIELGIVVALQTVNQNCTISANTFISGEINNKSELKTKNISEKMVLLASKNGAEKIIVFSKAKAMESPVPECNIMHYHDFDNLEEKISIGGHHGRV